MIESNADMNAFLSDALKRHESTQDVPIIILTARTDEEFHIRLIRQGVREYLIEPFWEDELPRLVETRSPGLERVLDRLKQGLARSRQGLRSVLRGLMPVAVDTLGLMTSLAEMVERQRGDGTAACVFECALPVELADKLVATQLFLIAQEAIHNAYKHARPTNVRGTLTSGSALELRIRDDGSGIAAEEVPHGGLGIRIMRHRAAIIGASLSIEPASPRGTLVACILPLQPEIDDESHHS